MSAARTRSSRHGDSYAVAYAVMAPSDCPATATFVGSTSPAKGPVDEALAARTRVMTKLMSPGWLTMSDSSGPPGAFSLPSGKIGAATTYPAPAQARSRRRYHHGVEAKPWPKTMSGNGPLPSLAGGYQNSVVTGRGSVFPCGSLIVRDVSTQWRTDGSPARCCAGAATPAAAPTTATTTPSNASRRTRDRVPAFLLRSARDDERDERVHDVRGELRAGGALDLLESVPDAALLAGRCGLGSSRRTRRRRRRSAPRRGSRTRAARTGSRFRPSARDGT